MSRKLFLLILMVAAFALPLSALAQPAPNDPSDVSPLGTEFRISISDEEDLNSVGHGTSLHALAMDNDGDAVVLMFDMMPERTLQARLYDGNAQPQGPQLIVGGEDLGGPGLAAALLGVSLGDRSTRYRRAWVELERKPPHAHRWRLGERQCRHEASLADVAPRAHHVRVDPNPQWCRFVGRGGPGRVRPHSWVG